MQLQTIIKLLHYIDKNTFEIIPGI